MVKRHQRPLPGRPNMPVGVIEKEGPLHVSNVAILDPKDKKPTRVRVERRDDGGRRMRVTVPLGRGVLHRHGTPQGDLQRDWIRPALVAKVRLQRRRCRRRGCEKITLNMGVGEAKQDSKMLDAARWSSSATIAGQQPNIRRARKSVANFKLREGMPVGLTVTLRDERAYEFLNRLTVDRDPAYPRLPAGLNPRSFDGRGNYSMGVREQIIFPEIDYDLNRPDPRPGRHDHHDRRRPMPKRSPCWTRSACRSHATDGRRASTASAQEPAAA